MCRLVVSGLWMVVFEKVIVASRDFVSCWVGAVSWWFDVGGVWRFLCFVFGLFWVFWVFCRFVALLFWLLFSFSFVVFCVWRVLFGFLFLFLLWGRWVQRVLLLVLIFRRYLFGCFCLFVFLVGWFVCGSLFVYCGYFLRFVLGFCFFC